MFGRKKHRPYYTKEGYKQVYVPHSPEARENGYAPEHRVIASKMLRRSLQKDEVVHHCDGNKRNNSPGNLQVMTRKQHWKTHHQNNKTRKRK